ncbi:MAG: hypothetical protein IJW43_05495 [Clostridia bacterium]|nr:hypothetical protein [Clostridia bacterium]
MEIYNKNFTVKMSDCDFSAKLTELSMFTAFLDCATEHGKLMKVAAPDLAKHNLFWVITKNKFRFYRRPNLLEDFTLSTWPIKPQLVRSNRFCKLFDNDGDFAFAKSEWVMLDKSSFRVAKHSVAYPDYLIHSEETILDEPWLKITDDFSTFNREFSYKVKSTDIDLSHHMNNLAYLRAMLSCLSTKELESLDIFEIEIHYVSQCFEGDDLSIRFIEKENGFTVGILKEQKLCTFINVKLK